MRKTLGDKIWDKIEGLIHFFENTKPTIDLGVSELMNNPLYEKMFTDKIILNNLENYMNHTFFNSGVKYIFRDVTYNPKND